MQSPVWRYDKKGRPGLLVTRPLGGFMVSFIHLML